MTRVDVNGIMLDLEPLSATLVTCCALVVLRQCRQMLRVLGKFYEFLACPHHQATLALGAWQRAFSYASRTPLICSGSTTVTMPWSAGPVPPKAGRWHPRLHYSKNMALKISRQSFTADSWYGLDMYSVPLPIQICHRFSNSRHQRARKV